MGPPYQQWKNRAGRRTGDALEVKSGPYTGQMTSGRTRREAGRLRMTHSKLRVEVRGPYILVALRGTCLRAVYRKQQSQSRYPAQLREVREWPAFRAAGTFGRSTARIRNGGLREAIGSLHEFRRRERDLLLSATGWPGLQSGDLTTLSFLDTRVCVQRQKGARPKPTLGTCYNSLRCSYIPIHGAQKIRWMVARRTSRPV
jgi:hypothetical protein